MLECHAFACQAPADDGEGAPKPKTLRAKSKAGYMQYIDDDMSLTTQPLHTCMLYVYLAADIWKDDEARVPCICTRHEMMHEQH